MDMPLLLTQCYSSWDTVDYHGVFSSVVQVEQIPHKTRSAGCSKAVPSMNSETQSQYLTPHAARSKGVRPME
jgi:hypothetical protein